MGNEESKEEPHMHANDRIVKCIDNSQSLLEIESVGGQHSWSIPTVSDARIHHINVHERLLLVVYSADKDLSTSPATFRRGGAILFDAQSMKKIQVFEDTGPLHRCALNQDLLVFGGCSNGSVHIYKKSEDEKFSEVVRKQAHGAQAWINGISICMEIEGVVSLGGHDDMKLIVTAFDGEEKSSISIYNHANALVLSPFFPSAFIGQGDGSIIVINLITSSKAVTQASTMITALSICPKTNTLVVGCESSVRAYDSSTMILKWQKSIRYFALACACASDDRVFVNVRGNETIALNIKTGALLKSYSKTLWSECLVFVPRMPTVYPMTTHCVESSVAFSISHQTEEEPQAKLPPIQSEQAVSMTGGQPPSQQQQQEKIRKSKFKLVAAYHGDVDQLIVDDQSGKSKTISPVPKVRIQQVCTDNNVVVAVYDTGYKTNQGGAIILDAKTMKMTQNVTCTSELMSCAIRGTLLVLGGRGTGMVYIMKRADETSQVFQLWRQRRLHKQFAYICGLGFNADNDRIVSLGGCLDGFLKVCNLDCEEIASIDTTKEGTCMAMSADRTLAFIGLKDGDIIIIDIIAGSIVHSIVKAHSKYMRSLAICPKTNILVSGADDSFIMGWDLITMTKIWQYQCEYHPFVVAVGDDDVVYAAVFVNKTVAVDIKTGEHWRDFSKTGSCYGLAYVSETPSSPTFPYPKVGIPQKAEQKEAMKIEAEVVVKEDGVMAAQLLLQPNQEVKEQVEETSQVQDQKREDKHAEQKNEESEDEGEEIEQHSRRLNRKQRRQNLQISKTPLQQENQLVEPEFRQPLSPTQPAQPTQPTQLVQQQSVPSPIRETPTPFLSNPTPSVSTIYPPDPYDPTYPSFSPDPYDPAYSILPTQSQQSFDFSVQNTKPAQLGQPGQFQQTFGFPLQKAQPAQQSKHVPSMIKVDVSSSIASQSSSGLQSYASRLTTIEDDLTVNFNPIFGLQQTPLVSLAEALCDLSVNDQTDLGQSLQGAVFLAKRACKDCLLPLNVEEAAAINIYTMETPLYSQLNKALRNSNRNDIKPFFKYLKLLLSALYKLPKETITVYRGVRMSLPLSMTKKGQEVLWWSLTSATATVDVLSNPLFLGENGERTMFTINATTAINIKAYSAMKGEDEYLLLPGSMFEVKGVLSLGHGLYTVQLNQISTPSLIDFHPSSSSSSSASLFPSSF